MTTLVTPQHGCGFVGKATTPGMADYSLRKHSCEKYRAAATSRARRLAAEARVDRTPKPCLHKEARHDHGTHSCYVLDRCRCWPCAKANTAYEGRRQRQKAYGRWQPYIDPAPAVAHVRDLMAAGVGLKQITKLSGVSAGVLWKLLYGKLDRDGERRPSTRVRRETAERLLAVRMDRASLAGGALVNATGVRRRLQALVTIGWSQARLGALLGATGSNFGQLLQREQVTKATAEKVAELYDQLWDTPPAQAEHRDKIAASRARNYARRHGWAPPLAWDEDTIDDPTATPDMGSSSTSPAEMDEVAVLRVMAGTLRIRGAAGKGTAPELVEAIRRLASAGWADAAISERLRMTADAVSKQRKRNDIPPGAAQRQTA